MPFIFIEDGPTLNEFMDTASDFIKTFSSSRRYGTVATEIVSLLLENRNEHYLSPSHPFNRFGDSARTRRENIDRLSAAVLERVQTTRIRSIVPCFFRNSGTCREDFDTLFDAFFDFVDESLDSGEPDVGNQEIQSEPIIIN